jgi:hypothetical protein
MKSNFAEIFADIISQKLTPAPLKEGEKPDQF